MNKPSEFRRDASPALQQIAQGFPIVCITGPRQSGKTTMAQQHFADKPYFNLEDPSQRARLEEDPKAIIQSLGTKGAIFDEVQHVPELLSYLQVEVDKQKIPGQFVISGSYNLTLMESVPQSLAGRVGLLELLPMSTHELLTANIELSPINSLYYGGLPRIFRDNIDPSIVYRNYVKTYIERDMRALIQITDLVQFRRFIQLCASRIGSEFNATAIGNELGISYHTVQSWLSVLEASYLVIRLQPYFENFGKRVIKSPKLYFTDVGLACYLLGIENPSHVDTHPLKGALFENLVVLDCYKTFLNQGKEARLYFYRDRSQSEIDLIWQRGHELIPIEIKYAQTYKKEFTKNLRHFAELAGSRVTHGYVIYNGEEDLDSNRQWRLCHYQHAHDIFND